MWGFCFFVPGLWVPDERGPSGFFISANRSRNNVAASHCVIKTLKNIQTRRKNEKHNNPHQINASQSNHRLNNNSFYFRIISFLGCKMMQWVAPPGPGPIPLLSPSALSGCNENDTDHLDRDQQAYPPTQKTKRMRTSFKHHQLRTMKSYFAINHNPDAKDLKQLAQKTGLTKRVLQVSAEIFL